MSGNGSGVDLQKVYVGFFWLDSAEIAPHRMASLVKEDVISAAREYLVQLKIKDSSWETFVLNGMGEWDGDAIVINTVDQGKIVLMSMPLGGKYFD